tara:strand:+ start:71 stop:703 length:633 start_codon:yes stop_codon:yes gene_type:complete
MMIDKEKIQRLCDSVDALMSEKLHTRITKLEDKGVEKVIVETIGPMLDRLTELEERNIGYKQDIVLLTQENSQMFERITALEEQHTRLHSRFVHHKEDHFKEPAKPGIMDIKFKPGKLLDKMTPPLVERLRDINYPADEMCLEAADRIEADAKEIYMLKHEPARPAMEEWIEVDGKMYARTEAADRLTALEKELHALKTARQAKIYNGPS